MDTGMQGQVTSLAYGWRLERSDGITLGFTTHDQDIFHDGLLLRASPGLKPTTVSESLGLENDGLDVNGAITSDAIRQDDLATGRWDAAYLEIFLFDWQHPDDEERLMACGELGSVSFSGDAFEAEFLGLKTIFDKAIVPQTSPSCRANFCDAACGLNREKFRHISRINHVEGDRVILEGAMPFVANSFAYGRLRILSGAHCGRAFDIIENDADSFALSLAPGDGIESGARIEIVEGCDKQITTCGSRFDNAVNFRGEPYLPGNDLLTRYPGAN